MNRLCNEVLQLIFYELSDPTSLILTAKRFHNFSLDPYVRAHYFLTRYGYIQALYHAFGRGKLVTERVLDILLTSGARLSRYLTQIAIHHYFHTQSRFIKTPWVRNVPLKVFAYFLTLAESKYGEIPRGKQEDDGFTFSNFLKESRYPPQLKLVSWETIRDILETYHFMPFCNKDPIMAQFPLALAIEPRLIPLAVANGFRIDNKYRDLIVRKMFERLPLTPPNDNRAEGIARSVRELCQLDSTIFVTRTVAAEICMEAKLNDAGYAALKLLDQSGHLRFELSALIEDLLKTFIRTQSITSPPTTEVLHHLYADFPSVDPTVRLVLLISIFLSCEGVQVSATTIHNKLEDLKLVPIKREDLIAVLLNPFVDNTGPVFEYARRHIKGPYADGSGIQELAQEVLQKCLEVGCKGKLVKRIFDGFPSVQEDFVHHILRTYQVNLEDIPSWSSPTDSDTCFRYEGRLCRDFTQFPAYFTRDSLQSDTAKNREASDNEIPSSSQQTIAAASSRGIAREGVDMVLGEITQESLTNMIRHDEAPSARMRRRWYYPFSIYNDPYSKLQFPPDAMSVGLWAKGQFGLRSSVLAIFMTHALLNNNTMIIQQYLLTTENDVNPSRHVPITFKHFRILSKLGRAPPIALIREIELGAEFFMDENDYITRTDPARRVPKSSKLQPESRRDSFAPCFSSPSQSCSTLGDFEPPNLASTSILRAARKRPRRSATSVRSYAVPGSDDEAIMDIDEQLHPEKLTQKSSKETNLQLWVRHLGGLCKEERRQHKESKRRAELAAETGNKFRAPRTDFLRAMTAHLRTLRRMEEDERTRLHDVDCPIHEYSDDDDDEYLHHKSGRIKRRKTAIRIA